MDLIKNVLFLVSFFGMLFYIANIFNLIYMFLLALIDRNNTDLTLYQKFKNRFKRDLEIRYSNDPTFSKKLVLVATLGLLNLFVYHFFQNETMGSYFEKESYSVNYYVNLYTNNRDVKNYKLIAKISAEHKGSSMGYFVEKIYFPNGGYLTFSNGIDYPLKLNKKVLVEDDKNRPWYVELTPQKTE